MIDTVIFTIPKQIIEENLKLEDGYYSSNTGRLSFKTFQRKGGEYFPKISIVRRCTHLGIQRYVKVEASLPKMLYQNNIQELDNIDFDSLVSSLTSNIRSIGIDIAEDEVVNASVSVIHYSKNILLINGYTSQFIIGELSKIDIRKSFDFSKTKYTNDGQSIYAYTNSHSLIIYDKIADQNKPQKRSIEKDNCKYTLKDNAEILRIEVRICNKRKIKSIFKDIGEDKPITFRNIFDSSISKKVINLYWNKLIKNNYNVIYALPEKDIDILKNIIIQQGIPNIKKALYLTALSSIARSGNGLKELRSLFISKENERTWYRIKSDIRIINQVDITRNTREWLAHIDEVLSVYEPITINSP